MNTIEKNGIPNQYTKGEVGDIYIDTDTGFKYRCESVIRIGDSDTLKTFYNWYGVREADKYKQQADIYESILTGEITEFTIPAEWTTLRNGIFKACTELTSMTIPNNIKSIQSTAFSTCSKLKNVDISSGVTFIGSGAFSGCVELTDITIPNTVTAISVEIFKDCSNLTNVTLGSGFKSNGLDLSPSTKYNVDTIVAMLTALADRTGKTAYTLKLGPTNLAKLNDEQKAIATDKNWTLA